MMKAKHIHFLFIYLFIYFYLFVDRTVSTAQSTVLIKAVNSLQCRSSLQGCYGEKQGYSFLMI